MTHRSNSWLALALVASLAAAPAAAVEPVRKAVTGRGYEPPRHLRAERELEADARHWAWVERLLPASQLRRLERARVHFELQSQFLLDPDTDPRFDAARHNVRDSYLELYREIFEREFPLDAAFAAADPNRSPDGSHRLRVSPRLSLGSDGYYGAKLLLPRAGRRRLDHLSFHVLQGMERDRVAVGLKYDDGPRYFQLEHVDAGDDEGDSWLATARLRF